MAEAEEFEDDFIDEQDVAEVLEGEGVDEEVDDDDTQMDCEEEKIVFEDDSIQGFFEHKGCIN
jgi:hypothetical protein